MHILGKVVYRLNVVQQKLLGRLPGLPLLALPQICVLPCERWPTEELVTPISSIDQSKALFETPIGTLCTSPENRQILSLLVLDQMRNIYERGPVAIRPGDIVIDLGAHIGVFSRRALSRGAAKVVAFEPDPRNRSCLEIGFSQEIRDGRLIVVPAAAWNEDTVLKFHSEHLCSQVSDHGEVSVQARTIDGVVAELGLPRIDFIKADIEGAERTALLGASHTIRTFAPRLALCTYHLPDDTEVIPRLVRSFRGYQIAANVDRSQMFFSPTA